MYSFEEDV